ncbi:long-chain fatty acid--CoA ligase [Jatrophihabitans sp.]|uniref:class I adenylate-forming enzyme family protein n=1 Tax=Jatrophihabitans sp. TaxID=1932789 RepID=UPI0030C6F33B|nr:AMP-dependent acyl-CoA synthetase/AMP-acid ligase [Jatrophihabitans sp.]
MNVAVLLDIAAGIFGDRVVVGDATDGLTGARLQALSAAAADRIVEAGADALVYLAPNGPAFTTALFAAARAGVPLIPLNYRLGPEQLDELVANHPRAIGLASPELAAPLDRAGITWYRPQDWLAGGAETDPLSEAVEAQSPAAIIYTSGTTSTPKGVLLQHANLTSYVLGTVEFAGAGPDEASLVSVPPYHIAAVSNVLSNLYAGRRTVVLESFTADGWLAAVREQRVTNAMVVPTMLARIMECSPEQLVVPSLRALAYGGARMPRRVIEKALQTWPEVDFVNAYGLTETSSTISVLGPEDHRLALVSPSRAVRDRLSSAGRIVPGVELEIRDQDEHPVPAGTPGQIWVRGEQVSGQYAGRGPSVDARGFFNTRDHGHLDDEGYLFVAGRIDDTIIRGGENIAPEEIEEVLLRHPAVVDAAVVGIPDEEWGQRIEAVVVLGGDQDLAPAAIQDYVRGLLRSSKTPARIDVWQELPRTATGKLLRREVALALAGPGQ